MTRRPLLGMLPLLALMPARAGAATLTDATGRTVALPARPVRVLPAGPPAAVLLAALAPDLMLGWPMPLADAARAALAPAAARLPMVPRLTGRADVTASVQALHPDLIVDYGTVAPEYAMLAQRTQAQTGIPYVLLDGALAAAPGVLRMLGQALQRPERAETLALLAEAILTLPPPKGPAWRVYYARGADGLLAAAPGTGVTEVFTRLSWQAVAPPGHGTFRRTTLDAVRTLDPDMIVFEDPAARQTVAASAAWRGLRAVQQGRALIAPSVPFGWIEEPPSLNRLLGLAWLGGGDAATLAALFGAAVYGRAPSAADLAALRRDTAPLPS